MLRALMGAIIVFALLCWWVRSEASMRHFFVDVSHFLIAWGSCFLIGMNLASDCHSTVMLVCCPEYRTLLGWKPPERLARSPDKMRRQRPDRERFPRRALPKNASGRTHLWGI